MSKIRNFAIIAHIDHGKSTLADRLLEITGSIKAGSGKQVLDTMDLEKERGITIKLNPARMAYTLDGVSYQLSLIDTPGHVDFGYEVSRSLAAVEGAILLVDATQGVQAQTLSNLTVAKSLGMKIIPAVNKIDLQNAQVEATIKELVALLECNKSEISLISAKTGEGVPGLLERVITEIPHPSGSSDNPARALVFDSFFDPFLGVVAYIKVVDGGFTPSNEYRLIASKAKFTPIQVGFLSLVRNQTQGLSTGEIGYVATGLKSLDDCRVGDTIAEAATPDDAVLEGYKQPHPMVFAGIYPDQDGDRKLQIALEKLKLNDSSLSFSPVNSDALGAGFTIGCLGLLHLEIVKERLEREYDLTVLITTPTVDYRKSADSWEEPWVKLEIISPHQYYGAVTSLASQYRCEFSHTSYLADRVVSYFQAPLSEVIVDFYNRLKSVTAGFASMDYQPLEYRPADLVKIDIYIADERVEALSQLIIRPKAENHGRFIVERLKNLIPRQNFAIKLQAMIGGKIIARADISPYRKDVIAKLYGGDVTRKNKLLDKQKKGKKRMRNVGKLQIPSEVFINLLKRD